ncbi:sterol desaturase [Cyanobium sp. Morenito 9A2]|uniref:sterol desaturase n=1 Tax=Cyanobium sp. Morenito 9A2 TaxID=2823718 RepID=UPI0020CCC72B|nr:sterol desaturase [Cyanobium sp. Morenito 9A2]MCP9849824.1 sterol desaturase [Cyanobium sp. Morenito 9A2]
MSALLLASLTAWLLLVVGDFLSTFFYHVPEHAFGRFHVKVHHGRNRCFRHYAVLSRQPLVILDGLLGALPYLLLAPLLWPLSPFGTGIGLLLGELHVVWRHVGSLGWRTPEPVRALCDRLGVVTPECHWEHHRNGFAAFGDIFSFYDAPAQQWLRMLRYLRRRLRALRPVGALGQA